MELKLVYRGLRQVSDWALRFYSDIHVDGEENVPRDGPLIMCVFLHDAHQRPPGPLISSDGDYIQSYRTRLTSRVSQNIVPPQ